ncbi:MAG: sodium:solute symporter [Prevotella sp.]|nr:sodium:solute symporter [Prevotella sp.]
MLIILTVLAYFAALLIFSRFTTRRTDNDTFFRGNRQSPWYMVAFGMVGASISGITFVSVPGMVLKTDMTYLQMCMGFIVGYFVVAFVLLPVYYRLNLTTIYSWLARRLGPRAYKTGASFFLLSKITGAAVRFYVVCFILQRFVLQQMGVPFPLTVVAMVCLIWLYTRRGGIKTLVWTDTFQTTCMFTALILIIFQVISALHLSASEAVTAIAADAHSRVFEFSDWVSRQHFWKQFLSGVFVTIVMTGLDQDMMQKNLTCRSLRDAQKDTCTYGFAFLPANLLFLALGILLTLLARQQGMALPAQGDDLLPMFAATGRMGSTVVILFTIGVLAAAFSSADSALTALTTSYCVDIRERPDDERLRHRVHIAIAVVFTLFILLFKALNSTSVIDAIYILCSYTYGPLLGLFAFGLLTRRATRDRLVPYICVASPLICYAIDTLTTSTTGYHFGYELLMLNGALTFAGLWVAGHKNSVEKTL